MDMNRVLTGRAAIAVIACLSVAFLAASIAAAQYRRAALSAKAELAAARSCMTAAPPPSPDPAPTPAPETSAPVPVASPRVSELQAQIDDLQELIAVKDRTIADLQAGRRSGPRGERRPTEGGGGGGRPDFRNMMEDLRQRDPQRYQAMQERMRAVQEHMASGLNKQQQFLAGLDTSAMTPEQASNHEKLMELLNQNQEILDAINLDPEAADVGELRRQIFENNRQIRGLMEVERTVALQDLAQRLGYTTENAGLFVDYVTNIFDATSGTSFRRDGDRPRPPEGSGPPPWAGLEP